MILLVTDIKRELSFVKLIKYLKYRQNLENAIINGNILEFLKKIKKNIIKFCKAKRKRKTSIEFLDKNIAFLDNFELIKPLKVAEF